jgi:mRNA interferase MazF
VVQADAITNVVDSVLACPLTTEVNDPSFRMVIEAGPNTGLRTRSEVMVEKLISFRQERVRAVIGRIPAREAAALDEALLAVLGLRA